MDVEVREVILELQLVKMGLDLCRGDNPGGEGEMKRTSAYVTAIPPVKRGNTPNKFGSKFMISFGRLRHETARLVLGGQQTQTEVQRFALVEPH